MREQGLTETPTLNADQLIFGRQCDVFQATIGFSGVTAGDVCYLRDGADDSAPAAVVIVFPAASGTIPLDWKNGKRFSNGLYFDKGGNPGQVWIELTYQGAMIARFTNNGWVKAADQPADLTNPVLNDAEVYGMCVHRGSLFIAYYTAGANATRAARVYKYDGNVPMLMYTFGTGVAFGAAESIIEFEDALYVGISGTSAGNGDIYKSTDGGVTWTKVFESTLEQFISAMVVFNGVLYAWTGFSGTKCYRYDGGTTWTLVYTSPSGTSVSEWAVSYGGRMFAALGGSAGNGRIVSTPDGINFTIEHELVYTEIGALAEFNGKLYAGSFGPGSSAQVLRRDDATGTWSVVYTNTNMNRIHCMIEWLGQFYIGGANARGQGDIWICDDDNMNFRKDLDTELSEVFRFCEFKGKLYAGWGYKLGYPPGEAQLYHKAPQLR